MKTAPISIGIRRGLATATGVLLMASVVACSGTAQTAPVAAAPGPNAVAPAAGDPSGIWKISLQGPGGREFDSTLTLQWLNGLLTGTMENRAGKAAISDVSYAGDQLSFTVVRRIGRRLRHRTLATRYTGRLEGDTITGSLESTGRDGQPVSVPWQAQRGK